MKILSPTIRSIAIIAAIFVFSAYAAAQAAKVGERPNEGDQERRNQVIVFNIDQLYAAVNDPQNAGRQIVAAPGTYMLSAIDSSGSPRPNGGRLEFQEDMSLIGVVGDRNAVVISGINLPNSSLTGGAVPLGAIRLGKGRNSVEWLTVRDTRGGHGNLVSGLTYAGTQYIRVAHVASTGAPYNLSFFNFGTAPTLEADIVDNDLYGAVGGLRTGFRIRNSSPAPSGGVINVRLIGNRVWGNQFSLITTVAATNGQINIVSAGNSYFDNGNGLTIMAGLNASGNAIDFDGYGDNYTNNTAGSNFDRGGLVIAAGTKDSAMGVANNNRVTARLYGCRFSGNDLWDLAAIGARTFLGADGNPGSNNHVTVTISGIPKRPGIVEFFADSVPAEYAATNSVTVIR